MTYCFDTCAFIESWVRHYPPDTFPTVWEHVDGLINDGRLKTSEEVFVELQRKTDDLHLWVKERAELICLPLDASVQAVVSDIVREFPVVVSGASATRNSADPWVIGTAIVHGLMVVTYEGRGSPAKPKIPDICEHYEVGCISMIGLFSREGWSY